MDYALLYIIHNLKAQITKNITPLEEITATPEGKDLREMFRNMRSNAHKR